MKAQIDSPWTAVEEFRRALRQVYGDRLRALVLYGSLARGEWTPESDIDVLVLLDNAIDPKAERDRVWRLAWELNQQYDMLVSPLVFTEEQYQRGRSPLFFNIRREGWFLMAEEEPTPLAELLAKSRSDLEQARFLLREGYPDGAVSRAYYAMFNAAQAALLSRGITRSKHRGVVSAFGYYFVRPGLIPQALHDALETAYQRRLVADYSPESLPAEEAGVVIRNAEAFLQAIEQFLATEAR